MRQTVLRCVSILVCVWATLLKPKYQLACITADVELLDEMLNLPAEKVFVDENSACLEEVFEAWSLILETFPEPKDINFNDPPTLLTCFEHTSQVVSFLDRGYMAESAIKAAVVFGKVKELEVLLRSKHGLEISELLVLACAAGHLSVLELLIQDSNFDSEADLYPALQAAIRSGHPVCLETLLDHKLMTNVPALWVELCLAIEHDQAECLCILLGRISKNESLLARLISEASTFNSARCMQVLLADSCADSKGLSACETLIVADFSQPSAPTINAYPNHLTRAFLESIRRGHLEILRIFLKSGYFDEIIAETLDEAHQSGSIQAVQLLLAHPEASAFWIDNHQDILEHGLLLKACKLNEPSCILSVLHETSLGELEMLCRCAASQGHFELFKTILAHGKSQVQQGPKEVHIKWLESLDYCCMHLLAAGNTGGLVNTLDFFGIPLGSNEDIQKQEEQLEELAGNLRHCRFLSKVLDVYRAHLALMETFNWYGLNDVWLKLLLLQLCNI